jgi:Glutathione S-transferase, C-terminal domain/Alpha/beta hydrolase family
MAGQNHHFGLYAPSKIPYAIDRYVKETNRLYGVLDRHLEHRTFIAGDGYSIADMASYPWIVPWKRQQQNLDDFPNLRRWFDTVRARPGTQRAHAKGEPYSSRPTVTEEGKKILFGQTAGRCRQPDGRGAKYPDVHCMMEEKMTTTSSVPRLSAWLLRFLEALGHRGPVMVAGHDIGGGVAQQLMLAKEVEVPRLAVVNGIMYDSWPVPGVARFRDPAVAAATTRDDVLAARRVSVVKALGRPASEAEIAEYLDPWTDPRVARSWLALAGAADNRYTQEILPALLQSRTPKLLVWGEDDPFSDG